MMYWFPNEVVSTAAWTRKHIYVAIRFETLAQLPPSTSINGIICVSEFELAHSRDVAHVRAGDVLVQVVLSS